MSSHNHTRKSVQSPVTANIAAQVALLGATPTDGPSEVLRTGEHSIDRQEEFNGPRGLCQATIDKLPDDVLLETFDSYLAGQNLDQWHTLVHVCRRWRNVVFASPRRLDLRLLCRNDRPVRAMLDIWPALPIHIENAWGECRESGLDNIAAALEHPDRVRSINLIHVLCPPPLLKAMHVRFPELTELRFCYDALVVSKSFLGGSAPRLRTLRLTSVALPAVRTLILSARDLVDLRLDDNIVSGHIPPTSMVACLSSLNKLESLSLGFRTRRSLPDRPSPPQPRVVLPALIRFAFQGTCEYSEDFVAQIDTPVLNRLHMTFMPDSAFDVRDLKEFIGRTNGLEPSKAAELRISSRSILLDLQQPHTSSFILGVRCTRLDWEVSSLALLCGQVSHLFSFVERLDLHFIGDGLMTEGVTMSNQFLEIFRLFPATQSLCAHKNFVLLIPFVLQDLIGSRIAEVLPNLRDLLLEGSAKSTSIQEAIQPFVDARRLSGQPVAVHYLEEMQKVAR
ncbi:hypothetical protein BC826DRAFT_1186632 [Russula brevipes]|nr:hypothetical protein BC826DRAFT_1186632 [Russula brevipes]